MVTPALLLGAVTLAVTTLPDGFSREPVPTGQGRGTLTDFAFLPDGSMVTAGKGGRITVVSSSGDVAPLAHIAVEDRVDLGLVGLETGGDDGRDLYTAYTYRGPNGATLGRVSRWRLVNDAGAPGLHGERVILDHIPIDRPYHSVNTVIASPDGTLFVSVGDGAASTDPDPLALRAQDPDSPNGKILRVNADGAGLPDNPFFDPARAASWRSRVYALGFRNPFRMALGPDAELYVGDVGRDLWDEIDVVAPGDNLGWPCWEGPARTPGYVEHRACARLDASGEAEGPAYAAAIAPEGSSLTAGVFGTSRYPSRYRGVLFFGDYTRGRISTIDLASGGPPRANLLAEDVGHPVRFRIGPEGDVYYADIGSGFVWRIRYAAGLSPVEGWLLGTFVAVTLAVIRRTLR